MSETAEDRVNGNCILLAYFEQFYRAWFDPEMNPLYRALVASRIPEGVWQRVCVPVLLQDLRDLSRSFYRRWQRTFGKSVIVNPTFAGSTLVGGADADIIVEGTLIEFKTTRQRRPVERKDIWQLLGYVLLDFEDAHRIRAVGFDYSRYGVTCSWSIDELTTILAGTLRPIRSGVARWSVDVGIWTTSLANSQSNSSHIS